MCLPLNFLKTVLGFSCYFTCGVGALGIIFGSIAVHGQTESDMPAFFNPAYIGGILMLIIGIIGLVVGFFGIIGARKHNRCCLCIFQFSLIPMILLSLAVAVLATFAAVIVKDLTDAKDGVKNCQWNLPTEDCPACGNDDLLEFIRDANTALFDVDTSVLGRSKECVIYSSSQADTDLYIQKYDFDADFVYTKGDGEMPADYTIVTSALQCENISSSERNWGTFLHYFEQLFGCSGVCSAVPFYTFYDTAVMPPKGTPSCYAKITGYFDIRGFVEIAWIIFVYFLSNLVFAFCLCCKKKEVGEPVYEKMTYY